MKWLIGYLFIMSMSLSVFTDSAFADEASSASANSLPKKEVKSESFEVNLLWPFFPGGISEFRYLMPIGQASASRTDMVGKLILGLYSDYASKVVRTEEYGKVSLVAFKFGYRYYFMSGWHAEITNNLGWRQERNRPGVEKETIEGVSSRLWMMAGFEQNISALFYLNYRLGLGVHLYRSDEYSYLEKKNVVGGDVNLGIRF